MVEDEQVFLKECKTNNIIFFSLSLVDMDGFFLVIVIHNRTVEFAYRKHFILARAFCLFLFGVCIVHLVLHFFSLAFLFSSKKHATRFENILLQEGAQRFLSQEEYSSFVFFYDKGI